MSGESKNPDCNDKTAFFQNKATGNCLFESVAQIFYPISWDFDNITSKNKYNDTVIPLANNFRNYVSQIYSNIYNLKRTIPTKEQFTKILHVFGLKEKITFNNQEMNLLEYSEYIKKDGAWAADDDLLILGKLLKINYRILIHQNVINYIFDSNNNSNIPTFTFCNLNDKHWVLHKHDHPLRYEDAFVEINKRFHELIWSNDSPPPPPLVPPPPPPLTVSDEEKSEEDEEKSEEDEESLIKIVVIYIFVNQTLLICINNDKDDKDDDKQKAPVVPVGIFESNINDKITFEETLAQAGLHMPENFNPFRKSENDSIVNVNQKDVARIMLNYGKTASKLIKNDDTIKVYQKNYYLFIDKLPDGYYDKTKPNSNKFFDNNTYPHYTYSKCALALIPLTNICDLTKNYYKNDYFNKVCEQKEYVRSIIIKLQNNKSPDNTTNQLSLISLSSASVPLISNEKDAINKIDAVQLLKNEQYSKQNKLKELKQDLSSFELEKKTKLTQINSFEQLLNNNGDLGLGTGIGTEMINNPNQFKSKRDETIRKQQNQEDINEKNSINQDNGIELTNQRDANEDNGIELTNQRDANEDNGELTKFKQKLETILQNRLNQGNNKDKKKIDQDNKRQIEEEIQNLQSSLVNTDEKITNKLKEISSVSDEITKLTQQIKEAEETNEKESQQSKQKAAQQTKEEQQTKQKAAQDAQVATALLLEKNFNNTINTMLGSFSGITTKTNWYLFIAFIITIILLSLLLHYKIIEYTPFLITICFVLATPIIIYLFTDNNIDPKKISPKINQKNKYYMLFIIFMIFMSICTLMLLLNNGRFPTTPMPGELSAQENQTNSAIVFSIITFLIVVGCICWVLLSMSEFKELFKGLYQISNVLYVIIYIIFLIIFFYLTSKDTQNTYAAIIFPLLILFGMGSFMYSFKQTSLFGSDINVNYERLKYFILLSCLITIIIIFYTINPGGYMTKYFGQTFSVAIAMMVFGFLFLVFSINLSDSTSTSPNTSSLISVFNRDKFVIYNILLFIIFIIIVVAGIVYFPGGFENNPMSILIIILLLIIFTGWVLFFGIKLFIDETENLVPSMTSFSNKSDAMKRILIMVFGLIFSSLLIVWLIGTFQNFASRSTIASGILNSLMIIFALSLIYKILTIGTNYNKTQTPTKFQEGIDLVLSIMFYIPCLITSPFDFFPSTTPSTKTSTSKQKIVYEYTPTIKNAFVLFVIIIILWILSLILPFIEKRVNLQGGTQIISNPIPTNNESVVASYEKLNGNNDSHYQYGMSFWVFINAFSPSTNSNYNKFTSLLNYGDKPNILYNGSTNTLMITMKNTGLNETSFHHQKLTDVDDNNNRILYKQKNVLLQKWNNITLNYAGGTLDVFVNGKLVKSNVEVIPYITLDNLIVGTNHGIDGGICNLVYFTNPLTITNVYYLYETLKNTTPPFIKT
jgi:hypothetical protein